MIDSQRLAGPTQRGIRLFVAISKPRRAPFPHSWAPWEHRKAPSELGHLPQPAPTACAADRWQSIVQSFQDASSQTLEDNTKETTKKKKASKIRCLWHAGITGEEPESHTLNCIQGPVSFFFFPFQLTPGLQAQSLRRNSGHENLLFSLSASGNTHSWLRLKLRAQPRRKKNIHLLSIYKHTANPILLSWGSPDSGSEFVPESNPRTWACCNQTPHVKCAAGAAFTFWLCSEDLETSSQRDTVLFPLNPSYRSTAYQSQATEMFPRAQTVLFPFHSCCVWGKIVSR